MSWWTRLAVAVLLAASEASADQDVGPEDCTQTVIGLSSCVAYVIQGSTTTGPGDTCCTGLRDVVKTDTGPACLCGAFNNGTGPRGVFLNDTRAFSIATDCFVTNYPNCSSLPKLNAPPPKQPVAESPPPVDDTPGAPGSSSSSSSSIAGSFKLLLRNQVVVVAATAVFFIF